MSKRKKPQKANKAKTESTPDHTSGRSERMSADELQHIIANAIMEAEDMKAKHEADKKAAELAEWHKAIGYDKNKKGIARRWNNFISTIRAMFVSKKYIKGDRASAALVQAILQLCFRLLNWICMTLTVLLIVVVPLSFILPGFVKLSWFQILISLLMAVLMFMSSRLFRIASIEAEKMEDRSNLYGLFASIASIISIVIAVIAIVKEK